MSNTSSWYTVLCHTLRANHYDMSCWCRTLSAGTLCCVVLTITTCRAGVEHYQLVHCYVVLSVLTITTCRAGVEHYQLVHCAVSYSLYWPLRHVVLVSNTISWYTVLCCTLSTLYRIHRVQSTVNSQETLLYLVIHCLVQRRVMNSWRCWTVRHLTRPSTVQLIA